jgi:hypothetical protein
MTQEDRAIFDSIVHGLRSRGWSRIDAEDEALERIERKRAKPLPVNPEKTND